MQHTNFFAENGLTGKYPTKKMLDELISIGNVNIILDLTDNDEIINRYDDFLSEKIILLKYPIKYGLQPESIIDFYNLIDKIYKVLKIKENVLYVHCRNGIGRSGIFVACYLSYALSIDGNSAILKTWEYFQKRKSLSFFYRISGSPSFFEQKNFVRKFHKFIEQKNIKK